MIELPQLRRVEAESAAIIHLTIPRREMMKAFAPAVGELMAALANQHVTPLSAVFAHHLRMSSDAFDFELGVKVAQPVTASGRVKPGELPAATVAHTIYSGPYEGLPSAWGEFGQWLRANGHHPAETLWELYSVGPHSTPVPAEWRTELFQPLKP